MKIFRYFTYKISMVITVIDVTAISELLCTILQIMHNISLAAPYLISQSFQSLYLLYYFDLLIDDCIFTEFTKRWHLCHLRKSVSERLNTCGASEIKRLHYLILLLMKFASKQHCEKSGRFSHVYSIHRTYTLSSIQHLFNMRSSLNRTVNGMRVKANEVNNQARRD